MSRLSSAFEVPPEPGSMLARLEESMLDSPFLATMAIMLAQENEPGSTNPPNSAEPLPHIDYHLVYTLISLAGWFDKRQLKPFDYLIDARTDYYRSHAYFRDAFVCLLDTRAYGIMLERENTRLANLGSTAAKELESNEMAQRKNNRDLCYCIREVLDRRKKREETTAMFSKMKYIFINTQMTQLIYIGKKAYQRAMELQGQTKTLPSPPVVPSQPDETQTAGTSPYSESLTRMLNADMSEEDLLRAAARVDNHTPQPPEYPDGPSKRIRLSGPDD